MIRELLSELFFSFFVSSAHKELVRDMSQRFRMQGMADVKRGKSGTNSRLAVRDLDAEYVEEH